MRFKEDLDYFGRPMNSGEVYIISNTPGLQMHRIGPDVFGVIIKGDRTLKNDDQMLGLFRTFENAMIFYNSYYSLKSKITDNWPESILEPGTDSTCRYCGMMICC